VGSLLVRYRKKAVLQANQIKGDVVPLNLYPARRGGNYPQRIPTIDFTRFKDRHTQLSALFPLSGALATAGRLTSFLTPLHGLKARIAFADDVQTSFPFDYLAVRVALFCALKRIQNLHR
jgi:hypothetical protein